MQFSMRFGAPLATLVASMSTGAALAHNHLTVDTRAGAFGDPITVKAGYLGNESMFSIASGRLLYNGTIAVYQVSERLTQPGELNGAFVGEDLFLTSDFYYATGRLNGGDFRWELSSVTTISGGGATLRWGSWDPSLTTFTASASSDAATRIGRSFDTMAGDHNHEQAYAFSAAGTYDVTFSVWDSNGRYADAAPLTVRFEVIPSPGALALAVVAGSVGSRRRRA